MDPLPTNNDKVQGSATSNEDERAESRPSQRQTDISSPTAVAAAHPETSTHTTKKPADHQLPDFKDQVRPAGFEAGENNNSSIPVAQSVHAIAELDEEPDDRETLPAAVLQTLSSGINAKNTVGTVHPPATNYTEENSLPLLSAINNSNNNPNPSSAETPPAPTERETTSQIVALRKHIVWARALVIAVIVVAVVIAVVIIVGGGNNGGGGSGSGSSSSPVAAVPTTVATPPTNAPIIGPPSTLRPTKRIPLEPVSTGAPTARIAIIPSLIVPTTLPSAKMVLASDVASGDAFGISVAINGDTVVIGARFHDSSGTDSGSAYIYTRSGTIWTEQTKLTASDDAKDNNFGFSVAIHENTIVIGAHNTDSGGIRGSAYVYVQSGSVWTQQAKLVAIDGAAEDNFGVDVAIEADTIVIGADHATTATGIKSGSVYVYTGSGTVWTEQAVLTASDAATDDRFGYSVAINGETIVIGAFLDDDDIGIDSGSAYVYIQSGSVWTQQAKLKAGDGADSDHFGLCVAIDGETIVIGAEQDDTENGIESGSVYVYTHSGTVWTEQAKLRASDGADNDDFGIGVAINGDTIVIGAQETATESGTRSGGVYVYIRSGTVWSEQAKLTASDGAEEDYFGFSVAIYGETIVIGSDGDDTENGGVDSGSVYIV